MTQRSYSNERYRKDAKIGKTRKSAAAAKPVRKQGEATSTKKTVKPKPAGQEKDWAGLPTSPEIKKWRRVWWVLLLGGLALIVASYFLPGLKGNTKALQIISVIVLALSAGAIIIDLTVIRRLRNELMAKQPKKKGEGTPPKGKATKADASDSTTKGDGTGKGSS